MRWKGRKNTILDEGGEFVKARLENFVADFGNVKLGGEGGEELGLLFEMRCETGERARFGMLVDGVKGDFVSASELGTRASRCERFLFTDVSVAAGEVVLDRNALVANVTFDAGSRAVFIFVFEPFASAEFDNGATVAFNLGGVDALGRHKVLALDLLAARGFRARESSFWAVSSGVLDDAASWMDLLAVFIGTADTDVIAHIDYQTRCFVRAGKEVSSASWALRAFGMDSAVAVLFKAGLTEGVVAVDNDGINERYMADRAH